MPSRSMAGRTSSKKQRYCSVTRPRTVWLMCSSCSIGGMRSAPEPWAIRASTFIATIFVPLFFTITASLRKRDIDQAASRAQAAQPADTKHTEEGAQ